MATAARRQPSTTSLAKYARAVSPDPANRSNDFCNQFWGLGDGGVDVLFARMRGASRSMEELRGYWKERASIEEDYAKRLSKLAKTALGRDEIGDLRHSLDTLRLETDKQSSYHLQLAQQIRADLEGSATAFCGRQAHHRKTFQSVIEKNFKAKQTQESYVDKARQKYETDCMRINSFTAQATLMQGKELEKVHMKLERAQQTVEANKRDFANFARALADTARQWEVDWKAFCDSCQDLEEDRMEFMKDNLWAYANAVSTVCVSDDESCEHLRVSLEQFEPERDHDNFIREYGTGNAIPDPPAFVDYNASDAVPSASARPTTRPANFERSSQRTGRPMMGNGGAPSAGMQPPEPEPEPEGEPVNQAGLGAGGGRGGPPQPPNDISRSQTQSRASTRNDAYAQQRNGASPTPSTMSGGAPQRRPTLGAQQGGSSAFRAPPADPNAEPIDPNSQTMLKVGANAYPVDVNHDPQQPGGAGGRPGASPVQNGRPGVGDEGDPLARMMGELRSNSAMSTTPGGSGGRRKSGVFGQQGAAQQALASAMKGGPGPGAGSPPAASPANAGLGLPNGGASSSRNRDYRNSAEFVVGAYPGGPSTSPPTAAFMNPPAQSPGSIPVEDVVADYHQSFPGESKRLSRQGSRRSSFVGHSPRPSMSQAAPQSLHSPSPSVNAQPSLQRQPSHNGLNQQGRPVSREGHVGIGANGRSTSPAPFQQVPISRSASPIITQQTGRAGGGYMNPPPQTAPQRAASPNSVGIALDPSGKVAVDAMADHYQQQRQPPPQQQQQQQQWGPPQPQQGQPPTVPQNRRLSYGQQQAPPPQQALPPQQTGYGPGPPGPSPMYAPPPLPQGSQQPGYAPQQQQPQRQPTYQAPPPQPAYQPPAPPQQQPPPQQQQYQQQQYQQQQPPQGYPPQPNGQQQLQRGQSAGGSYYQQQPPQQQQAPPNQYMQEPQGSYNSGYAGYRAPSPQVGRSPSPQPPMQSYQQQQPQQGPPPTGQYTEDGKPVLFYVKALYDYQATIEEEFDFQAGDIIAVTSTPEDGWWSGELLDEARRQPRRHIFPSNFVCLF